MATLRYRPQKQDSSLPLFPELKPKNDRRFDMRTDITGMTSGKLTAAWPVGRIQYIKQTRHGYIVWMCFCECGGSILEATYRIKSQAVKSCGCVGAEHARRIGRARKVSDEHRRVKSRAREGRWVYLNREKLRATQRRYWIKNRDKMNERHRAYRKKNPEKWRELQRASRSAFRLRIYALYGGKCGWPGCEWTDIRAMQLDHKDRAREHHDHPLRGGWKLYREILEGKRNKDDFQLLCANHNAIKMWENKEFANYQNRPKHPRVGAGDTLGREGEAPTREEFSGVRPAGMARN